MRSSNLKNHLGVFILLAVTMCATMACGRNNQNLPQQEDASDVGSVAFQITLADTENTTKSGQSKNFSLCNDINTVTAMVLDGDQTIVRESWACSDRNGTLTGILPGFRNIIVQGVYVDNDGGRTVFYEGHVSNIFIQAGETTEVGPIACSLVATAPVNDADQDGDGFTPNEGDCDDTNNAIYPGAAASCPIQMPNLADLTRAEAEDTIDSIKMVVGTISQACSDAVSSGRVISHDPISGTQVQHGTTINLVVSTGLCPVVCQGNQDPGTDCTTCLPGYTDNDNDCGTLVRYVDTDNQGNTDIDGLTWDTALPAVQDAIDLCEGVISGDTTAICEVWVAEGTYYIYKNATHNSIRPRPRVHVYGGFTGTESSKDQRDWENRPTTLSAHSSSDASDHVSHVITCEKDCLIDGFIVSDAIGCMNDGGGMINLEGSIAVVRNVIFRANEIECYSGGGLNCAENSDTSLVNCRFENNEAEYAGALSVFSGAVFSAKHCVFDNNFAWGGGGAAYLNGATAVFSNCQFNANTGSPGAAVEATHSDIIFSDCTFNDNLVESYITDRGGAVSLNNSEAVITNCGFVSNLAKYLGGAAICSTGSESRVDITSSYFYGNTVNAGNSGAFGGAIYAVNSRNINLTNCTLVNNSANGNNTDNSMGGGIYIDNSPSTITNSIIRGNIPDQVYSCNLNAEITYSNVTGIYTGDNGLYNIDMPVFFVDENLGNLHLLPYNPGNTSVRNPCIDSAHGDHAPELDYDGNPRVDDLQTPNTGLGSPGYTDMGAFEYQP